MRFLFLSLTVIAASFSGPAEAGGKGKKSKDKAHKSQGYSKKAPGYHCPPGLAKKPVPCVPPGQAKQYYRIGDRILNDFDTILNPRNWGLKANKTYYRSGGYVYDVDPDTATVLGIIGLVDDLF